MVNTILLEGFYTANLTCFPDEKSGVHLFAGPKQKICRDERCLEIIFSLLPELETLDAKYKSGAGFTDENGQQINDNLYLKARSNTLDAIYRNPQLHDLYLLCSDEESALRIFEYTDRIAAYWSATKGVISQDGTKYYLRQKNDTRGLGFFNKEGFVASSEAIEASLRKVISLSENFAASAGYFLPDENLKAAALNPEASLTKALSVMLGVNEPAVAATESLATYEEFAASVFKPAYRQAVSLYGEETVDKRLEYFLNMISVCQPQRVGYESFLQDFIYK